MILHTGLENRLVDHATDCESDRGDFKYTSHESNKQLYVDNVTLLINSNLIGFGAAISIKDFQDLFPGCVREWPYYLCFSGVVARSAEVGRLLLPPTPVKVTFDQNGEKDFSTRQLYQFLREEKRWPLAEFLANEIEFGDHGQVIGIQAADLLARETMKYLDNQLLPKPPRRWTRQSLIELKRAKRFRFLLLDRKKLEAIRDATSRMESDLAARRVYTNWLADKGLSDSLPTRLKFLNAPDIEAYER